MRLLYLHRILLPLSQKNLASEDFFVFKKLAFQLMPELNPLYSSLNPLDSSF